MPVSNSAFRHHHGHTIAAICRVIRRMLVPTADVVRRFARYHKYTVGTDMRTQDIQLMRYVHRAVVYSACCIT